MEAARPLQRTATQILARPAHVTLHEVTVASSLKRAPRPFLRVAAFASCERNSPRSRRSLVASPPAHTDSICQDCTPRDERGSRFAPAGPMAGPSLSIGWRAEHARLADGQGDQAPSMPAAALPRALRVVPPSMRA